MNIKLNINGKEQIFTVLFIKAKLFRKVLELREKIDFENIKPADLDELVGLVVETYNNQFSVDDFYEGVSSGNLMPVITETFNAIANINGGSGNAGK